MKSNTLSSGWNAVVHMVRWPCLALLILWIVMLLVGCTADGKLTPLTAAQQARAAATVDRALGVGDAVLNAQIDRLETRAGVAPVPPVVPGAVGAVGAGKEGK